MCIEVSKVRVNERLSLSILFGTELMLPFIPFCFFCRSSAFGSLNSFFFFVFGFIERCVVLHTAGELLKMDLLSKKNKKNLNL